MNADELFECSLMWLRESYQSHRFFMERDIVWTVQLHLLKMIQEYGLPYLVFHNHPITPGKTADIAILSPDNSVEVAAEFKYEPDHKRSGVDIWHTKFDVVFWEEGVGNDVKRARQFVNEGAAKAACTIFIDEGAHFTRQPPFAGSEWLEWNGGVLVLRARFA